jgi:hypothetical protein
MTYQLNINSDSELRLIKFGIYSDNETSIGFYVLYRDSERPIDYDGFPILFFDPNDMGSALSISDCGCNHLSLPSVKDTIFIDITSTIYEIGECSRTTNTNLFNTLDRLCDFVTFFHEDRIHSEYSKIIHQAAHHFATSYDIEAFFNEKGTSREELIQSIEWVVGATMLWAKYIRPRD